MPVAMASSISRSLRLRSIYGSLTAQCRLNKPSFYSLSGNSRPFTADFPPAFAAINFRFLCTTATGSSINQSNSNAHVTGTSASRSSEGNSGNNNDGKGSGGSLGKPVRGGPVSWMSFFLLLCTGAGLVYYYDREKKRHIEEEKSGLEVLPIFISVDPERDTVEQVSEYVKEFHPKLIGLTGSPDEIKKAARAYRVYYMKTEEEGSDYLVDHSIVMYLMDPNMQFVKFFGKNVDADSLADGVIQEIKQHKLVKA